MDADIGQFLQAFYGGAPAATPSSTGALVPDIYLGSNVAGSAITTAGPNNGLPFAIDWFGTGANVSGNPGLVASPDVQKENVLGMGGGLDIEQWFIRGAVIVLGFIFVAAGLSMFKSPIVAAVSAVAPP